MEARRLGRRQSVGRSVVRSFVGAKMPPVKRLLRSRFFFFFIVSSALYVLVENTLLAVGG